MPDMSRCAALARQAAAQIGEHPAVESVLTFAPDNQHYVSLAIFFHRPADGPHEGLDLVTMHDRIGRECAITTRGRDFSIWEHPNVLRVRWEAV